MHNLVIDIGNTNSKLAVFNQKELVHYERLKELDEASLKDLIEKYQIQNATVSSVNKDIKELSDYLKQFVNYIHFTTEIQGKIKNNYQTLSTLGLDRWAKVIAAHCLYPSKNCLMIDAGTCITYDVLTATNEYFGGSISLGIKMRFEALNHYTGRLPLVNWNNEENNIPEGTDTINAIKNGVLQGILNEVEGFISLENKRNKDLKVIITGGDADFLNMQLKNSIFATQIIHEPYLVLKGLNEVITL
ncbi:type III pantothenate kinase [Pedobacter sp. LMG 31464]|uniref:Type III pantothenate kinase n=1 Tax=Pedobacter planticolens TaxID=2679964 RepID=A0A923IX53_9SPHI|nr:type III pantothenate kinase [Pedobacter planticolens]MBB2145947.1 type III pantothenate kinase [Pedobacter planticolens]